MPLNGVVGQGRDCLGSFGEVRIRIPKPPLIVALPRPPGSCRLTSLLARIGTRRICCKNPQYRGCESASRQANGHTVAAGRGRKTRVSKIAQAAMLASEAGGSVMCHSMAWGPAYTWNRMLAAQSAGWERMLSFKVRRGFPPILCQTVRTKSAASCGLPAA